MRVRNLSILLSVALVLGTFGLIQTSAGKPRTYVVALVSQSGGFVMPSFNFTRMPDFVIYSDGQMISYSDVITQQYPGPAIPTLRTKYVNGDLKRIVTALESSKLTDPKFNWGYPGVADVPNTDVLTQLSAQKRSSRVSVYALGFAGPGVSKTQAKYRKKASQLIADLQSFSNKYIWTKSLPTTWTPSKYAYQVTSGEPSELSTTKEWVGAAELTETSCAVLSKADSAKITQMATDINTETLWNSGGKTWRVNFRPLLPHESSCKSFGY